MEQIIGITLCTVLAILVSLLVFFGLRNYLGPKFDEDGSYFWVLSVVGSRAFLGSVPYFVLVYLGRALLGLATVSYPKSSAVDLLHDATCLGLLCLLLAITWLTVIVLCASFLFLCCIPFLLLGRRAYCCSFCVLAGLSTWFLGAYIYGPSGSAF